MGQFHWGKEPQKLLGNFFLLPLKVLESSYETTTFHQRISPKPVGQKKNILSFIESNTYVPVHPQLASTLLSLVLETSSVIAPEAPIAAMQQLAQLLNHGR